jgi:hypothetical protein
VTASYELCTFYHLHVGGEFFYLQAKENNFDAVTKEEYIS